MDFLEESFRSDPWLTFRFRKYMAGPKRIPWKNQRETVIAYRWQFCLHWFMGGAIFWPFAVLIGRRMKHGRGGVPAVPVQRFVEDWPNVEPARHARRVFAFWSIGSSLVFGYCFAKFCCNPMFTQNEWYNRPDLKPFAAMVEKPKGRDITEETMKTSLYAAEKKKQAKANMKKSAWYRYFFTLDADFEVKENPYAHYSKQDIYNTKNSRYATYTNDFYEHHQK
jgi:hypothetical protein